MVVTLTEVKGMETDFITPSVAARVIGADPQSIREQAKRDQSKLGFPVIVIGHRIKIPRLPFIRYIEQGVCDNAPR